MNRRDTRVNRQIEKQARSIQELFDEEPQAAFLLVRKVRRTTNPRYLNLPVGEVYTVGRGLSGEYRIASKELTRGVRVAPYFAAYQLLAWEE